MGTDYMYLWIKIIHLGDTVVMIPVALTIAAWLMIGRAWRAAMSWSLLFGVGLGLVVASKMAYLGWGIGIRSLDFKALSGHATLTSAIIPVLFFLGLQQAASNIRALGVIVGMLLSGSTGVLLVVLQEHTAAEAVAGCLLGGGISVYFMWTAGPLPSIGPNRWLIPFGILAFLAVVYAQPASLDYWMTRVALYLSGHNAPYSWFTWELESE